MIKILFVCHGNICRSPMAEFIMKDKITQAGLQDEVSVDSAAVSREEIGNDLYGPAQKALNCHGIPWTHRHAVQISSQDYEKYDYIIMMDHSNLVRAEKIFKGDPQKKLSLLMKWAGKDGQVADPWYTGDFEQTYLDLTEGCEGLLNYLKGEENK